MPFSGRGLKARATIWLKGAELGPNQAGFLPLKSPQSSNLPKVRAREHSEVTDLTGKRERLEKTRREPPSQVTGGDAASRLLLGPPGI